MRAKTLIGILLTEQTSATQVGMIDFDPSGVLVFHIVKKGLHVFALKPVERILSEKALKKPLYVKYAHVLKRRKNLAQRILRQEASSCADILNKSKPPLEVAGERIKATVVRYPRQD